MGYIYHISWLAGYLPPTTFLKRDGLGAGLKPRPSQDFEPSNPTESGPPNTAIGCAQKGVSCNPVQRRRRGRWRCFAVENPFWYTVENQHGT